MKSSSHIASASQVARVAAIVLLALLAFSPARAQTPNAGSQPVLSAGPISLVSGESALIGLLLPACGGCVQSPGVKPGSSAHLVLLNGDGKPLLDVPLGYGSGGGEGYAMSAYFTITFTGAESFTGGVFHIVGPDLKEVNVNGDGRVAVVLVPGTQRGVPVFPVAASLQLFSAEGKRMQVVGFADGSV